MATFETAYRQVGKHRKKCHACRRLIQDGELVIMESIIREKWYPVKGLMSFVTWYATHKEPCIKA